MFCEAQVKYVSLFWRMVFKSHQPTTGFWMICSIMVLLRWFSWPMLLPTEVLRHSTLTSMHWRWQNTILIRRLNSHNFDFPGRSYNFDFRRYTKMRWRSLEFHADNSSMWAADHFKCGTLDFILTFLSMQCISMIPNQQEPSGDPTEITNVIRHVRPGNGFEPTFPLFARFSKLSWQLLATFLATFQTNIPHQGGCQRCHQNSPLPVGFGRDSDHIEE